MKDTPTVDYLIGLDLGQARDYTAAALLERTTPPPGKDGRPEYAYAVRWLHRWKLGTPYTTIVNELAALVKKPPLSRPLLAVDQTGVGRAVVDVLRAANIEAFLKPILITAGHGINFGDDDSLHVPKKELVSTLQVLLQSRRFTIAKALEYAGILEKELLAFKVKITAAANETFESWRERDHDDLVLAVAMAAWLGERPKYTGTWTIKVTPTKGITPSPRHSKRMGAGSDYKNRPVMFRGSRQTECPLRLTRSP